MTKHSVQNSLLVLNSVIDRYDTKNRPVSNNGSAMQLRAKLDVSLGDDGADMSELEEMALNYLNINPDVSSAKFNKLLYSGLNAPALFGDWVTSISNATMHTYQVSPVATLMELELINQWNKLVGFNQGEGVMVSGGSQANLIAMLLARHKACPQAKTQGIRQTLVAYVSDQAHYSSLKAINVLGIGSDNLISVASDEQGRIIPAALEEAIKISMSLGHRPFYVGLTAGTTVLGAYDPVAPCAAIAKHFDLWLHIDGAWGAPILFSSKHRHLLADANLADSVAWDAHKLMNVPLTAAVILTKEQGLLKEVCSGGGSDYLFHADENAAYNLGERSIQCGRRADALKVWMSWKAIGNKGFEEKIDYLQQLKTDFVALLAKSRFELLHQPSYLNVLFRYNSAETLSEQGHKTLCIDICAKLKQQDIAYSDYASCKGRSGIRLILANANINIEQLQKMLTACDVIVISLLAERDYSAL
ncbi:MAG: glutamate decarboxylase [Oceanospirillaceae bacterium]|nr:glutamate decarboxylase [Oceanospirillaceae bacterium]